jgi:hypothetical protein
MSYLYVKTGGTCTTTAGRFSSPKTGSWATALSASQYYTSLANAKTYGSITAGDYILVSSTSSGTNNGMSLFEQCYIISVDDSNVNVPKKGYQIIQNTVSAGETTTFGGYFIYGLVFNVGYALDSSANFFRADYPVSVGANTIAYDVSSIYDNCEFNLIGPIGQLALCGKVHYTTTGAGRLPLRGIYYYNSIFTMSNPQSSSYSENLEFTVGPNYFESDGGPRHAVPRLLFNGCTFSAHLSKNASIYNPEKYHSFFGFNRTNYKAGYLNHAHLNRIKFDNCDFYGVNRPLFPHKYYDAYSDYRLMYNISFSRCRMPQNYEPTMFSTFNLYKGINYSWCNLK